MSQLTPRPDAVPPLAPNLAPGRSCTGCTTCCKLLSIEALKKPAQTWCEHCDIGAGCKVYAQRPDDCRTFYCGWVLDGSIGEEWDPKRSKMVVKFEDNRIVIHVDKDRKDAWRKEPFHSQIRRWASDALLFKGQVLVWEGLEGVLVFGNGERRIGRAKQPGSDLL